MILFTESTTIGLRISEFEKVTLKREFRELLTEIGTFIIKESFYKGKLVSRKPEYNDCVTIARKNNMSLKDVYRYVNDILTRENSEGKN